MGARGRASPGQAWDLGGRWEGDNERWRTQGAAGRVLGSQDLARSVLTPQKL